MITSDCTTTNIVPEAVLIPGWVQDAILLTPRSGSFDDTTTDASLEMKCTDTNLLQSLAVPSYSMEIKPVLYSSQGHCYEISSLIKKALYGDVVKGCLLQPYDYDCCPSSSNQVSVPTRFTRTDVMVAIKFYSRSELAKQQGKAQENPLFEIAMLQEVHNYIRSQGDKFSTEMLPFVEPIECCYDENTIFLVMEYREGLEMFDYVEQRGPLTEQQAINVFRDLLIALEILEACGISHRDISLENILFDGQNATLIDFGMSIKLDAGSRYVRNSQCGKVEYMPPEMICGCYNVDGFAGDIWSTAVCFLSMLLGATPMDSASESDVRYQYLVNGKLSEMLEYWEMSLSPMIIDLLNSMFKEHAEERATASQLLKHPLFAQQPSMQKPASPCVYKKVLSIPRHYLCSTSTLATPYSPMTDLEDEDDEMDCCESDVDNFVAMDKVEQSNDMECYFYVDVTHDNFLDFTIPM